MRSTGNLHLEQVGLAGKRQAQAADEDQQIAFGYHTLLDGSLLGGGHSGEGAAVPVQLQHAHAPADRQGLARIGVIGNGDEVAARDDTSRSGERSYPYG